MRTNIFLLRFVSILLASLLLSAQAGAQTNNKEPASMELYGEIAHMDSVFFNAFNTQNLEVIKTLFTDDLEFYHDKNGLSYYRQNMEAFKNLFEQNNGIKRELVKSSLEVYPIKNYGAVEIGLHKFCHMENGKEDCGTFKFIHVWQKKDGSWKISRVISYDH
jgi:hypothetical protein